MMLAHWTCHAGDAAEDRSSWQQNLDDAGVFRSRRTQRMPSYRSGRGIPSGTPASKSLNESPPAATKLYRTDEFGLTTFLLGRDGGIHEVLDASNP